MRGQTVAVNERTHERTHEWTDPVALAALADGRTGLEFMRGLSTGELPPPPFLALLGMRLVEVAEGHAVFELDPAQFHYNAIGGVHGGVYASLLDSACGCAVHTLLPAGVGYTSLDLTSKFLRGITVDSGPIRATGSVLHLGRRTGLAQAQLTDADGRVYGHATSSVLVLRP